MRRLCNRACTVFGNQKFERLVGISASHIYNLRKSAAYRKIRVRVEHAQARRVSIGDRRQPDPKGEPGYLRVDTALIQTSIPLQKRFFRLCEQSLDSKDEEVRVLASALFQHCGRLFAFIEYPGVEPANNSAERALRHAVMWRKSSFANQSSKGEVATADLLTVARTCVRQRRNAIEFLSGSVRRYRAGEPVISLLQRSGC